MSKRDLSPDSLEAQADALLAAADSMDIPDEIPMPGKSSRSGKAAKAARPEADHIMTDEEAKKAGIVRLDDKQVAALPAASWLMGQEKLRELLARGEGWEYLSPAVYGYILRHGLYGAGRDLKRLPDRELRACSYSMIRAKRIAHVKGTEEEAVRLARRWGADEEHARRAAILHDCTKYLELDEQLQLCAKYGIVLDELEQQAVKLLHSKTGACVARHVYGVSDDIYEAIFWHTTGKADMTLLEKLLYIADYMEPTRDFPGVERLRALAYEDLDAAVLLGCEMSIQEMAERGLPVHPNTVKARDWLRSKTKGTSD